MCMKRLRTDEIDTVSAPSPRLPVQQRKAVFSRQDECVAGCFGAWQPSEVGWHALEITPVSPIYWLAPGERWVSQKRHSVQPTTTGLVALLKARRALWISSNSPWTNCCCENRPRRRVSAVESRVQLPASVWPSRRLTVVTQYSEVSTRTVLAGEGEKGSYDRRLPA
jgi:hypothetical protein